MAGVQPHGPSVGTVGTVGEKFGMISGGVCGIAHNGAATYLQVIKIGSILK